MIKLDKVKLFRKKQERPGREKAEIHVKYETAFDITDFTEGQALTQRGIIEDINKKGIRLTIIPALGKEKLKEVKRKQCFYYLEFTLPPDGVTMRAVGLLRWTESGNNVFPPVTHAGVEFANLKIEEKVNINRFLTWKKRERNE
jgi:hypothetical protein